MEFTRFMGSYQSVCNIVVDCLNHWTTGNMQRTDMLNLYIRLGWNLLEENKENVACLISSNMAGNVWKSQQNDLLVMLTNAETQAWAVVTGSAVFSLLHHHRLRLLTWKSAHKQIIWTHYGSSTWCGWHVLIYICALKKHKLATCYSGLIPQVDQVVFTGCQVKGGQISQVFSW